MSCGAGEPANIGKGRDRLTTMPLGIVLDEQEGIQILTLTGQLTLGQEDLDFRKELERLLASGKTRIVLNLTDLTRLDSTGLGTLLFIREKLRKAGGNLAVFNMHRTHIALLVESKLETSLEMFQTEQDAVNSFFPEREPKRYDILEFVESLKKKNSET
jgi:anti-sigma B factor antagonist